MEASALVETFYDDALVSITILDPISIEAALVRYGFSILSRASFHILSSLALRFTRNAAFAARLAGLDAVCKHLPLFRLRGCNYVVAARRNCC